MATFAPGDQFKVSNFEQRLIAMSEHYDTFLEKYDREHPVVVRDRIARESYPLFSGLSQASHIWHPGLGPQAGISEWKAIQLSQPASGADGGYNACTIHDPQTYGFSVEKKEYTGMNTEWRSPVICVNDAKYTDYAKQQVGYIFAMGVMITSQAWEVYSREMYVQFASEASNLKILGEGMTAESGPQFKYDPFETYIYDEGPFDANEKVTVLKVPVGTDISTLNMTYLDIQHELLSGESPQAAISSDGGFPVFGIMLHLSDIEKMVMTDPELRQDMRYAKPQMLFENYSQTFRQLRGWAMIHDPRQMRFKYWKTDGTDLWFRRVLPMREGRDITIGKLPEFNPEYVSAELAVAIVFLNDVYRIRIPGKVDSLGASTSFGPAPGYNGDWMWMNYQSDQNPYREVGYFAMRMAAFPKPLRFSTRALCFAYRRCPQTWPTTCSTGTAEVGEGAISLAADAAATDVDSDNNTVTVTLASRLSGAIGDAVLVKSGSDFNTTTGVNGFIASDAAAPTYVLGFTSTVWDGEANLADHEKWTAADATVAMV